MGAWEKRVTRASAQVNRTKNHLSPVWATFPFNHGYTRIGGIPGPILFNRKERTERKALMKTTPIARMSANSQLTDSTEAAGNQHSRMQAGSHGQETAHGVFGATFQCRSQGLQTYDLAPMYEDSV